ncbi:hypothetical protein FEM48_Zijuj01G0120200 [Ziziphus jujuba var. spinosa]|uniref:RNase H type-1 domain-containing protein n=1 Tax=Ziziphus jujuba var. spinosa TaxID=714518 RepID=A0A978W152_ZIZJJ|nr:hypothetical protein FEM48_Zijuj01G0120200 [Ziziphus jujuba var. spinosa]
MIPFDIMIAILRSEVEEYGGEMKLLTFAFNVQWREAELQAIHWASAYAEDKGWNLIEWSSDAALVVKKIVDQSTPPLSWFTYFEMIEVRVSYNGDILPNDILNLCTLDRLGKNVSL